VAVECTYHKGNDQYQTPNWIKQGLFVNWFDPCPLLLTCSKTPLQDGLAIDWPDYTFVNPPYSQPLPWIEKAILENKKEKTVALLLKHDSSTKWYKLLHQANAHFLMPSTRLHFSDKKAAPFPSIIAILHKEVKRGGETQ
jgi:hypothetical protein